MTDLVKIERREGVLEILFDRPAQKNALTLAMYSKAAQALREASDDDEVRSVMIVGAGNHFTSGNDLFDFMQNPPTDETSPVFQFLLALRECACPVVAGVEGYAIGIGTTMLLHCDMAWAAADSQFRLPFVDLGLVPEAGSSVMLAAIAGHRRAAELLYLGDFFDAQTAKETGIINDVVDGELREFVLEKARRLAEKPPVAMRLTKELMRATDDEVVEIAMRKEAAIFVRRLQSKEFMAAVASFQK